MKAADIRVVALEELAGSKRMLFLMSLACHISFAARGNYVEAGNSESRTLTALRAVNEMMIVVTTQLSTSFSGDPAYPDDAFIQVLSEYAGIGDCKRVIGLALWHSLIDVGRLPAPEPIYPEKP